MTRKESIGSWCGATRRTPECALRVLVATLAALAAPCVVRPASAAATQPATVAQWARFEAAYEPATPPSNPFDPDVIDVRAEFVSPGGKTVEVDAFWFQDYERSLNGRREKLTATGTPHFLVRFTPTRPGRWRWRWVVRTPGSTTELPYADLLVKPAKGHGFLRTSKRDPRQLAFDDRTSFFAIGENTGWYDSGGTYDYDDWFAALAAQGANYARVWMPSWAFGIEWSDTGLGDYTLRLDRAWQLDHVLEEAERDGIYVMLSLLNHGAFSSYFNSEWAANPYNAANGGPLATPAAFFTDPTARRLFERRLRYIVARWGWSTHVQSWELWNEVDLTDGYNPSAVAAWHADMAAELRALDPNHHLVTTSHAIFADDPVVWQNGGLDFTQLHYYAQQIPRFADLSKSVTMWTGQRLDTTKRPVLFAELGIASGADATRAADPDGIGVHDGLWAGVVSGGFGTAMTWWWDTLIAQQPDLYYPMFGSVARFVAGIRWDRERFRTVSPEVTVSSRPVIAYALRGRSRLLVWLKDDVFQWNAHDAVPIPDATLRVDGRWCGQWYDPWTGTWLDRVTLSGAVAVPTFSRDLALLAAPCPARKLHPD